MKANAINNEYIGNGIVQDDIFRAIYNYCRPHCQKLEILRFPIKDNDLCACTFLREDTLFTYINTFMPLSKQIFAAGHEFYHIYCYLDEKKHDYHSAGSIINSSKFDNEAIDKEDKEANAFAGVILAPEKEIENQIRINNINRNNITLSDVMLLVDIFGIPYKAMVLRLFESNLISHRMADYLSNLDCTSIQRITGLADRWLTVKNDSVYFGSLNMNIYYCEEHELVDDKRISEDKNELNKIRNTLR